mmetsp:Transcript_53181/g.159171  ORF Transcript_53181/g.159171 Transcript_53181/m.159171 type:complete len:1076 (-) Transcript_53181:971-4198(-)
MTIAFERPVGAAADLSELEYISALHQSQPGMVRKDGSIRDVDIMHFILSRYGIKVDLDAVRNTILVGLGGDFEGSNDDLDSEVGEDLDNIDAEDNEGQGNKGCWDLFKKNKEDDGDEGEEGIDLAEMVAILLIPPLLKSARIEHAIAVEHQVNPNCDYDDVANARKKKREDFKSDFIYKEYKQKCDLLNSLQPEKGLIRDILVMILKDVTGTSTTKPRITTDLMRNILVTYGEEELAEDEHMLDDMVRAASADGELEFFDVDAFALGLTSDVLLYNPECEARVTSNYDDIMMAADVPCSSNKAKGSDDSGESFANEAEEEKGISPDAEEKLKLTPCGSFANEAEGEKGITPDAEETLKLTPCAPALDFVADQFMSKKLTVLLWVGFILFYFAYYDNIDHFAGVYAQIGSEETSRDFVACYNYWDENAPSRLDGLKIEKCLQNRFDEIVNSRGISSDIKCDDINGRTNYGCLIGKSIVGWLYVLAKLIVLGMLYIGVGSVGNSVRARRKWPMIFGVLVVAGLNSIFFYNFFQQEYQEESIGVEVPTVNATGDVVLYEINLLWVEEESNPVDTLQYILSVVFAWLAVLVQLSLMIGPTIKKCCFRSNEAATQFFTSGSLKAEAKIKQAAARKINTMVKNAREVHGIIEEGDAEEGKMSYGQGLVNYSLHENCVEQAGGFIWTWSRLISGELFSVEGVWISARLWAGNLAQVFLSLFIIAFGVFTTNKLVDKWREGLYSDDILMTILGWLKVNLDPDELSRKATEETAMILDRFTSLNLGGNVCFDNMLTVIVESKHFAEYTNSTEYAEMKAKETCQLLDDAVSMGTYQVPEMVKNVTASAHDAVNNAIDSLNDSIYPESEYMVRVPLIMATVASCLSALTLAFIYIPSAVSTTLKLRSGVIPFFHDTRNQKELRSGMDQTTILMGAMFWGLLYSAALLGIVIGFIVFLFLWQATRKQMAIIFTSLVGLVITISLKVILVHVSLNSSVYASYYRKKPRQGNIVSLILEVTNIGYAITTALGRAAKLIIISILYTGRLDTPLLAPGVSIGPLGDVHPLIFRKEILAHEAHRHPMLELLG